MSKTTTPRLLARITIIAAALACQSLAAQQLCSGLNGPPVLADHSGVICYGVEHTAMKKYTASCVKEPWCGSCNLQEYDALEVQGSGNVQCNPEVLGSACKVIFFDVEVVPTSGYHKIRLRWQDHVYLWIPPAPQPGLCVENGEEQFDADQCPYKYDCSDVDDSCCPNLNPPPGEEECEPEIGCIPPSYEWDPVACECYTVSSTPILVSAKGNRLSLTDRANGVYFDLNSDGEPELTAWTTAGADDAFLVLDRNGNGLIDDGTELFGDTTPQPESANLNGFLALAQFDRPAEGGNGDGEIDDRDAVFARLAFWMDLNHDGISQPGELRPVADTPVASFSLSYRESRRVDKYGNEFRYIADVELDRLVPGRRREFAVDVIFTRQ